MGRGAEFDTLPLDVACYILEKIDGHGLAILRSLSFGKSFKEACKEVYRLWSGVPMLITSVCSSSWAGESDADHEAGKFGLHRVLGWVTGHAGCAWDHYHPERRFQCQSDELKGQSWLGGKDDWLVTSDEEYNLKLVNPVTGGTRGLPKFSEMQGTDMDVALELRQRGYWGCKPYVQRVVLCRTPRQAGGYMVIVIFSWGLMAFVQEGEPSWTALTRQEGHDDVLSSSYLGGDRHYFDAILVDGNVVAVTKAGSVLTWDIDKRPCNNPRLMIHGTAYMEGRLDYWPVERVIYIAKSPEGNIILICMFGHHDVNRRDGRAYYAGRMCRNHLTFGVMKGLRVYELLVDPDNERKYWRLKSDDFGGHYSLFLGANYPFFYDVPYGSSSLQGGRVYVSDMDFVGGHVGVFRLDKPHRPFDYKSIYFPVVGEPKQVSMFFRPTSHD
jgi:hypothetical protein